MKLNLYLSLYLLLSLLLVFSAYAKTPEEAQNELKRLYPYSMGDNDFIRFVKEGKLSTVKLFLDAGTNPNTQYGGQESVLMIAAKNGKYDIAKLLISKGADVNMKERDNGKTALMYATTNDSIGAENYDKSTGYAEIVKLLIANGAEVNEKDYDGHTALILAGNNESPEVCKLLIANGAEVNAKTGWNWTALMNASFKGNLKTAKLLIESGATMNINTKPFHPSNGIQIYHQIDDGKSPLMYAIENKHLDLAKLLIEKGCDVSSKDRYNQTALILMVQPDSQPDDQKINIVKLLISKGADINAKSKNGDTALKAALRYKFTKIAQILKDSGAME